MGGTQEKKQAREYNDEGGEGLKDMVTSTILLCLVNNTFQEVLGLTGSIDIWDKLEIWYMSKLLTSMLSLKTRLFSLQMTEEVDFNQHLDKFNKITMELDSLQIKIEE